MSSGLSAGEQLHAGIDDAVFDLTPRGIIERLDLCRPIYAETAAFGHFGRELAAFTWERTDCVDALQRFVADHAGGAA